MLVGYIRVAKWCLGRIVHPEQWTELAQRVASFTTGGFDDAAYSETRWGPRLAALALG